MKKNINNWIMVALVITLITTEAEAIQPFSFSGAVRNSSNNGIGEGNVSVAMNYTDINHNNKQVVVLTNAGGGFAISIDDYLVPSNYTINESKGDYMGPMITGSIENEGAWAMQDLTISLKPINYRVVPKAPVINKGDTIDVNISTEPQGNEISALQIKPNISYRFRINDYTEGDLFNRHSNSTFRSKFNFTTNDTDYVVGLVLTQYASYNTSGIFSTINMTSLGNGTANLTLEHIITSTPNASWIRSDVYLANIVSTQPCDVNGDFSCNLADLGKINQYWNQTGSNLCPEVWGRCDLNNDDSVNAMDKALEKLGYGKQIIRD